MDGPPLDVSERRRGREEEEKVDLDLVGEGG